MATVTGVPITNAIAVSSGLAEHHKFAVFAASGDVGTAINVFRHTRITVQVVGTFTGGLDIIAEGSLEDTSPTNFFPLTEADGTAVEFLAVAGGKLVAENVKWIRLRATDGSGSATVTGYILALI